MDGLMCVRVLVIICVFWVLSRSLPVCLQSVSCKRCCLCYN